MVNIFDTYLLQQKIYIKMPTHMCNSTCIHITQHKYINDYHQLIIIDFLKVIGILLPV